MPRKTKPESIDTTQVNDDPGDDAAKAGENRSITAIPRDASGRFLRGCPPGPGRPPKSREQANLELLHDMLDEPVGPDGITRKSLLILSTIRAALAGDAKARELLYDYLLPPKTEAHDVRMLTLQGQFSSDDDQGDVIEPWDQPDAAETIGGAVEELIRLGYVQTTEQWEQANNADPEESDHVVNDLHHTNGFAKETASE